MERALSNPRVFQDLLDREVGALDRLVEEVLVRNAFKKPVQKVEAAEAVEMAAGV